MVPTSSSMKHDCVYLWWPARHLNAQRCGVGSGPFRDCPQKGAVDGDGNIDTADMASCAKTSGRAMRVYSIIRITAFRTACLRRARGW